MIDCRLLPRPEIRTPIRASVMLKRGRTPFLLALPLRMSRAHRFTTMARRLRVAPGGFVYHVVNRAAGRLILFETSADYAAFERLLSQAQNRTGMRILAYCLMRNHWHLLPWPVDNGSLSTFMQWLTGTHAQRWAVAHDAVGRGAVYQSRFKSMPVQSD